MRSKSINFAMGFHNHQPVGNFDYVLEDAYQKAYWPFIKCLERHSDIKVVLHYTGPLWDEYLKTKPEWIEKLKTLVKRGQVELLSGGYFEPILVNISDRNKIGQIKMMSRIVRQETGYKPQGMWLAERIWEPGLPKPISLAGIKYTVLDENHFWFAGIQEKDTFGYYVTEDQGYPLSIFPINYNLRQMIPHDPPERAIEYLRTLATEDGNRLAVFADDGEKFGVWPDSHRITWEEKWMDRFFELLEKNSDWIKTTTLSEYYETHPPIGRTYLPTGSYLEMTIWSLPTPEGKRFQSIIDGLRTDGKWNTHQTFVKGGFWRNFLVKYPESNRIQKKALYVGEKIDRMVTRDRDEAETALYMGQCNCPYWHGVFGGTYLPHLRHGVQQHLIRAEYLADEEFHKGNPYKEIELVDINRDLRDEVIVNTKNLQLSFYPHLGGTLYELDNKPDAINLCDTLTRREEIYHEALKLLSGENAGEVKYEGSKLEVKEKGLEKHLVFDKYQRCSFIDHFIDDSVNLNNFSTCQFTELGDFIEKPYEVFTSDKEDKAVLTLSRRGKVTVDDTEYNIELEKTFLVPEDGKKFSVLYWLTNESDDDLTINFAPEINFSFQSKDVETNYIMAEKTEEVEGELKRRTERYPFTEPGKLEQIERLVLRDGNRKYQVSVSFGQNADVLTFPIETVSMSESGYEKVFQSVVTLPIWKLNIEAGDSWDVTMEFEIENITTFENEMTEEVPFEELMSN
jgi:4-alpha-glucanotransferase